jgi:catecholate siderophore receptor
MKNYNHKTMTTMILKTPRVLMTGVLLTALTASSSWAQEVAETGQDTIYELEDYVVTEQFLYTDQVNALQTPTPIIDVPQSLSIIGSEEIALRGFDSIGDIVNYTPGVNNAQGEGHRDAVVFRGSRSTGSFFVDGVRDDVEYYRPLYNVEQLEILRGPNALLFGRGGTGGIINRVLKKGTIGQTFTEYQLSVDTFGAYSAQIDSNFAIDGDSAFRINAFYENLDNHRDHYDGDRFGVTPTAKFLLGEKTTLDVTYEYNDNERFIDRGIPTGEDGKPAEELDGIFFGDEDVSEATFEAHVLRAALQHRFSDELKARFDLAYGDYDKYYANYYTSKYDETVSPEQVTLSGYVDSTQRETLTLSGGLIGEFETGDIAHTLVAGVEFVGSENNNDRMKFDSDPLTTGTQGESISLANLESFTGRTFDQFGDNTEADLRVFSLYIQDEIALLEQLDLVLGARYDRFDFEVDVLDVNGNLTDRRSQVDEEITPRLGLVFKPRENISLYASYSQTFLPQSGEQFASVGGNNLDLDPDEFINLEAGMKWDFNPRMSFTAAIFDLQQDGKDTDKDGNPFDIETNVHGFEAQFLGQITDAWFLSAGYSYLDGEIEALNKPAAVGNRPRELPEHSFSVWNRYQLTEKLGLGLGVIYQDATYITEDNDTELPSYVRVDAAAYYEINENLRLQLNIENLLDEDYYPHAHGDHQVSAGAPIHARLTLTGRF